MWLYSPLRFHILSLANQIRLLLQQLILIGWLIDSFTLLFLTSRWETAEPWETIQYDARVNVTVILTVETCPASVWEPINPSHFSRNEDVGVRSDQTFPQSSAEVSLCVCAHAGLDITHAALWANSGSSGVISDTHSCDLLLDVSQSLLSGSSQVCCQIWVSDACLFRVFPLHLLSSHLIDLKLSWFGWT